MVGKFNAGGSLLQRRSQHGSTLDDANAVRQHQRSTVYNTHGLRIFPADLHDFGIRGDHIIRALAADQLHSLFHGLHHSKIIKTNA